MTENFVVNCHKKNSDRTGEKCVETAMKRQYRKVKTDSLPDINIRKSGYVTADPVTGKKCQ